MSRINGKDTVLEVSVRSYLHEHGFRFRKNDSRYPGKPDILLPKYNTIVFIHGCFWHGHDCKEVQIPKTNTSFWDAKIKRNIERDAHVIEDLKELDWRVIVLWECEINNVAKRASRFQELENQLIGSKDCLH
jgi:DNA mismatch endonuclease, patch repair protein